MSEPNHKKAPNLMLTALVLWLVLVSVGPILVVLIHAAIPLVIVVGVVLIALRLVFSHTGRW